MKGFSNIHIVYVYQDTQNIEFGRKNDENLVFVDDSAPPKTHFFGVGWSKIFGKYHLRSWKLRKHFGRDLSHLHIVYVHNDAQNIEFGRKNDEHMVFVDGSAPPKTHIFGVGGRKFFGPHQMGSRKLENFFSVLTPFTHPVRIQDPKGCDFRRK